MDNALGEPQTIALLGGTSDIGLAIVRQLLSPTTRTVVAKVSEIVARLDVKTLRPIKHIDPLNLNDIGLIRLRLAHSLQIDDYARLRRTGAFLLIDPANGSTIAAGMSTSRPRTEFSR